MRDYPGQSGTDAGQTLCLLGFCGAVGRRVGSRLLVGVFPRFGDFRGGVDGFDPLEKSVYRAFEGSFSFIRAFPRGLIGRVQTAVQWAGNSRETGSLGPAPSAIPSSCSSKLLDVNNF